MLQVNIKRLIDDVQCYQPMVLVFYRPYNHISILQTKLSDREGHKA